MCFAASALWCSLRVSWIHSINTSCGNSWYTEKGPVARWLLSHHRKYPQHIAKSTNIPNIPESVTVTSHCALWCLINSNENGFSTFSLCCLEEAAPCGILGDSTLLWCTSQIFYLFRCFSSLYFDTYWNSTLPWVAGAEYDRGDDHAHTSVRAYYGDAVAVG